MRYFQPALAVVVLLWIPAASAADPAPKAAPAPAAVPPAPALKAPVAPAAVPQAPQATAASAPQAPAASVPAAPATAGTPAAVAAAPAIVFPKPPRLATTEAELEADKKAPDFAERQAKAVKAADALVGLPIPMPDAYGSWIFYYACPDDGSPLDMITLTDHVCPKCKKHYHDARTVAAYRCVMHYALEHRALALGWAYAYTGDKKYIPEVKRILLKLADDYHSYPTRLDRWGHRSLLIALGGARYLRTAHGLFALLRGSLGDDEGGPKHESDEPNYLRETAQSLASVANEYYLKLPDWLYGEAYGWTFASLGGRRYVQSLDEAVGVIRLAKAYDLTRNSDEWSDDERRHVEQDFFRATADSLLLANQGINNHQTWYNAGLISIASVLGDAALVEKVLHMHGGYYYQLQHSLGDDGLWYEGSMAYQGYALQAMLEIVDACRRLGLPVHDHPRFKALLTSPLKMTYPDGTFACINDSDPGGFQIFKWSYEWAWKVYHDPVFAQAVAWGDDKKLAELLGPDAKPATPLETRSIDCPDGGVAILRAGQGDDSVCMFLHYGIHGGDAGGHGHYDKLGITLYANKREWLVDIGRIGYTFKEYLSWAKRTVAHNTVTLGGVDQWANTGKLLWLTSSDKYSACAAQSTRSYRGATLRRYLLVTPKMVVDVFDVAAETPTQIDWLAHAIVPEIKPFPVVKPVMEPIPPSAAKPAETKPVEAKPAEPKPIETKPAETKPADAKPAETKPPEPTEQPKVFRLGSDAGYQHLLEGHSWPVAGASCWDFMGDKPESPWLRVWLAAAAGEEIYTATGIGHNVDEKAPCLLRRRHGQQTRFVTVYDLSGKGDYVTKVEVGSEALPHVKVQAAGHAIDVQFEAAGVKVAE